MKHISVRTKTNDNFSPSNRNECNSVNINNLQEKWHLNIACQDNMGNDKEMTSLTLHLPDKSVMEVTVQDLMTMQNVLQNAMKTLDSLEFCNTSAEVLLSIGELEHLISLFKKA